MVKENSAIRHMACLGLKRLRMNILSVLMVHNYGAENKYESLSCAAFLILSPPINESIYLRGSNT